MVTATNLKCPKCGSPNLKKAGKVWSGRKNSTQQYDLQRYLCTDCHHHTVTPHKLQILKAPGKITDYYERVRDKRVVFEPTDNHEHCEDCEAELLATRWGEGWLFFCLKCLKVHLS